MILCYARVSSADQVKGGSINEQERKNRAVASLRGASQFDIVSYIDDGISGSIPLTDRLQGGEMLRAAKKGDVIVAAKLDRLFRSATDAMFTAQDLARRGVDLILIDMGTEPVTRDGIGKLFFGILSLLAEFERERIAERTSEGRKAKKAKGGHIGGEAPYGWKKLGEGKDATLVPDVEEQDVIRYAHGVNRQHNMFHERVGNPYRTMRILNDLGMRSRAGKPFQVVQVQRMLHHSRLANVSTDERE